LHALAHADARTRTLESYAGTLAAWTRLTGDPPIEQITPVLLAQWRSQLAGSSATVAKHCRQLNVLLAKLGPPGPWNRDAVGVLPTTPWVKPPRPNDCDGLVSPADPDAHSNKHPPSKVSEKPRHAPVERRLTTGAFLPPRQLSVISPRHARNAVGFAGVI